MTEKARSPSVVRRVVGMTSVDVEALRRRRRERGYRNAAMSVLVCLRAYLGNYMSDLHRFYTWPWRCDTSCTSGFLDDAILARDGPWGISTDLMCGP